MTIQPNNFKLSLSQDTLFSVASNTGELAGQKKSSLGKQSEPVAGDTFQSQERQLLKENGLDLAQKGGHAQDLHEDDGKVQDREEQNRDRNIDAHEEKPAKHQVTSPKGVVQALEEDDHQRLQQLDSKLHTALNLNSDLKPEQLAAARRMVETQPGKIQKNAELKYGPEAEKAVQPELAPVPLLCRPMGICAPGSDKQQLLNIEMGAADVV